MKLENLLLLAGAVGVGYYIAKRRAEKAGVTIQKAMVAPREADVIVDQPVVEIPVYPAVYPAWGYGPAWSWGGGGASGGGHHHHHHHGHHGFHGFNGRRR